MEKCTRGHPRTKANTYVRPNGKRDCRICQSINETARRARASYQPAFAEPNKETASEINEGADRL
jgi:hypothetical protein